MMLLKLVSGVFIISIFSVNSSFARFSDIGKLGNNKTSTVSGVSLHDKLKIQDVVSTASDLAKNVSLDLKSNQGMFSVLSNYASTHNIAMPQEAVSLLKVK